MRLPRRTTRRQGVYRAVGVSTRALAHHYSVHFDGAVAAKSAGKKVLDVLADKLKSWLEQKPNVKEITLYGPDGEVVKVVKKK
jgi:hypothetical protein